jgi:SAM-dependent methyltransferase
MPCLFCSEKKYTLSYYPINDFNKKLFIYKVCTSCELAYLDPLPNEEDYNKMYPPTYQNNEVATEIQKDWYQKLPGLRFSYGYQFDLIKKHVGLAATIMDYGCGNAHFIINAQKAGFNCAGAEYNPEYVSVLNENLKNITCVTIADLLSQNTSEKYDVIRLSNVFEHLTTPKEVIKQLSEKLSPNGIFLIEGPIEDNFSLAQLFRKFYFRLNKWLHPKRIITFPPYHIFFSNYKNQKSFFENMGLSTILFKTDEDTWPFPSSIKEAKGIQQKLMAVVGKISMQITKLLKNNWGNIFIYIGKNK